tara:strand:- start:835 stop:1422 length:588 start_codon:yes stop_codon:yes gene_type:complete
MNELKNLILESKHIFKEKELNINQDRFIIVQPTKQILYLVINDLINSTYNISTSKYGLGNKNESFQTPIGIHYIAKKIGDNVAKNTIFKGRKTFLNNLTTDDLNKEEYFKTKQKYFKDSEDIITSRIMWLKGHEKGVNQGGNVDSYSRYIYIHGTIHENLIGTEASHGCIRMNNNDVIDLYDKVLENILVRILDN